MPLSRFEKFLPWTGLIAGLAWTGQDLIGKFSDQDDPGAVSAAIIHTNLDRNDGHQGLLIIMGVALLFFATAVRNLLRSGEAREATYSNIAYAGWIVVVAGLSQMVAWGWALISGAADASDETAAHILGYGWYFGWAGMGIGLATTLIAFGLGGIRNAVLPKWFAILSIILGVLGALGDAGLPPGGLVNYLLLPLWLVAASIIIAIRQRKASTSGGIGAAGIA